LSSRSMQLQATSHPQELSMYPAFPFLLCDLTPALSYTFLWVSLFTKRSL
jgi:hypothetical protein